ncbi:hypothetical protein [Nonomuraea rhizosphaerae]|nr:hypothetical protein [Nonomuraea rhizosphaerae]
MGLNILLVIIASVVLGFILGVFATRPRAWVMFTDPDDKPRRHQE